MRKLIEEIKEYGSLGVIIASAILAAAVSYGSSQAVASMTFQNHEKRISAVEDMSTNNTLAIAKMSQKIDDLWHDAGHKERY